MRRRRCRAGRARGGKGRAPGDDHRWAPGRPVDRDRPQPDPAAGARGGVAGRDRRGQARLQREAAGHGPGERRGRAGRGTRGGSAAGLRAGYVPRRRAPDGAIRGRRRWHRRTAGVRRHVHERRSGGLPSEPRPLLRAGRRSGAGPRSVLPDGAGPPAWSRGGRLGRGADLVRRAADPGGTAGRRGGPRHGADLCHRPAHVRLRRDRAVHDDLRHGRRQCPEPRAVRQRGDPPAGRSQPLR